MPNDTTFEDRQGVVRKQHTCELCGEIIPKGWICNIWRGIYDGEIGTVYHHVECNKLWNGEEYGSWESPVPEAVQERLKAWRKEAPRG